MIEAVEEVDEVFPSSRQSRTAETERAFAATVEGERKARIEKTIRLKALRLTRQ